MYINSLALFLKVKWRGFMILNCLLTQVISMSSNCQMVQLIGSDCSGHKVYLS